MTKDQYCWDIVLKLLSSISPLIMYFVPKILIVDIYDTHVLNTYVSLPVLTKNPGKRVKELDDSIAKIISFVSFISIIICSIFSLTSTTSYRDVQFHNPLCATISLFLLTLSIFILAYNVIMNFVSNKLINILEIVVIFLITLLIFYSNYLYELGYRWLW